MKKKYFKILQNSKKWSSLPPDSIDSWTGSLKFANEELQTLSYLLV
jgi:hypothetical protein